jgi:hypothetical protein
VLPGDIYVMLLVLTAVFVAPFSRLAFVVVVAWTIGHFAFIAGAHEHWVNLLQHLGAAAFGMRYARQTAYAFAWALFAPLVTIDLIVLFAGYDPDHGWWLVLGLATLQLFAMPFGIDRGRARALFKAWKENVCWQRTFGEPGFVAI